MTKGAFQVSREIFENEIWSDIVKFRIFFYILGKAVFSQEGIDQAGIHLERGQYLRSLRNLQSDLSYKEGRGNAVKKPPLETLRRKIKSLEKEGRITTKSTEYGTLFTVVNYAKYQGFDHYKKQSMGQQWDGNETAVGQRWDNNKNGNNAKNDNKDINTLRSKLKFETHHMKLAELLFKKIKENNPSAREPNLESWANTFRLMMERPKEKRSGKDIQDIILWSQSHHFWYKNVLSADKLRKQFDRLQLEMKDETNKPLKVINGGRFEVPADEQFENLF